MRYYERFLQQNDKKIILLELSIMRGPQEFHVTYKQRILET